MKEDHHYLDQSYGIANMSKPIIPCKECLLKPICRHKSFRRLLEDCSLLFEYEPAINNPLLRNVDKLFELEKILEPSWYISYDPIKPHNYPPGLVQEEKYRKGHKNDNTL
jgi:hypothetical protein